MRRRPVPPNAYIVPPSRRQPLFTIDGRWYVDLLFNFDEPLIVTPYGLTQLLDICDLRRVVLGWRLSRHDASGVAQAQRNILGQMHSYLVRHGAQRWTGLPRLPEGRIHGL